MAKQVKLAAERRTATGRSAVRKLKARGAVPGGHLRRQRQSGAAAGFAARHQCACSATLRAKIFWSNWKSPVRQEPPRARAGSAARAARRRDFACRFSRRFDGRSDRGGSAARTEWALRTASRISAVLLEQNIRSLAIECLPRDLPDIITVDVSALNIGDSIHVREIPLPTGRDDEDSARSHRILGSGARRWKKSRLPPKWQRSAPLARK